MEVLGLSSAASPYGSPPPKRQVEATSSAPPEGDAPKDAPLKSLAVEPLPKQKQVLIEPIARFSFGYTFVNPETQEVVQKWPVQKVITPGTRVDATV